MPNLKLDSQGKLSYASDETSEMSRAEAHSARIRAAHLQAPEEISENTKPEAEEPAEVEVSPGPEDVPEPEKPGELSESELKENPYDLQGKQRPRMAAVSPSDVQKIKDYLTNSLGLSPSGSDFKRIMARAMKELERAHTPEDAYKIAIREAS